jgi:predicted DNA-binding transcriptional regulator YafY
MSRASNNDLLRQIEIAAAVLEKPGYYSEKDLCELFDEISVQSIRRDAEKLRTLGIDIHSRKQKYSVDSLKPKILNDLICTYLALNKNDVIKNLNLIVKKFGDKTLSIFVKTLKAISRKQVLAFQYGRDINGEPIRRLVTPINISRTPRNIYIIGIENDDVNKIRFYLFEKIIDIKFTGKKSIIKNMPDVSEISKNTWGTFTGGEVRIVKLKFTKKAGEGIKNKIYIETQEIEELEDAVIMKMKVNISYELISWIMGWGGEVIILEPESLRLEVVKRAKEIIANNI